MKDQDFNVIDRFLYKLLIVTVLLLSVVLLDKIEVINMDSMQTEMSQHINFLSILKSINGDQGVLLPKEITEEVADTISISYQNSSQLLENSNFVGRKVKINDMQGVEIYKAGIVVAIHQNNDQTYKVTVKGIDNYEYVYDKLASIDCNIYKLVSSGENLGLPAYDGKDNYFYFYVYDNGKVVDLFSSD